MSGFDAFDVDSYRERVMRAVRERRERELAALYGDLIQLARATLHAERGELDDEARRLLDRAGELGVLP